MKLKNLLVLSSAMMLLMSCGGTPATSSSSQPGSESSASQPGGDTSATNPSSEGSKTDSSAASTGESGEGKHGLPIFKNDVVTEPSVIIHYFAIDDNYVLNAIWCWKEGGAGDLYEFEYEDAEHGEMIAVIPLSKISGGAAFTDTIGIIFRKTSGWDGQTKDLMVDLNDYEMIEGKIKHVYFMKDDDTPRAEGLYVRADKFTKLTFISPTRINLMTTNDIDKWTLYIDGQKAASGETTEAARRDVLINFATIDKDMKVDLSKTYEVEAHFILSDATMKEEVSFQGIYGLKAFNDAYAYDGDDLGAVYTPAATTFKVWSPVSSSVTLRIYDVGTPVSVDRAIGDDSFQEVEMTKGEKGVFSTAINGDLNGKYYTYFVVNKTYPKGKEIVDPYAKSCGVNGLRGQILNFENTNPENWDKVQPLDYNRKGLAIYETHLVDPTYSDSWSANPADRDIKGTYAAFHKAGTYFETSDLKRFATGFDHIRNLGVNAVQIMPIFDQANDEVNKSFNWGYNPLNYNCLEGSYASDPYNGEVRIREFKELVRDYNESNINVIMDVVYNHVNSVNGQNFDVLMPGYYFRYDGDGNLSNGSGCGNETASDHYMYQKFMIDSAKFWATEYKLGGFRFDLMGLHDLDTMNKLTAAVKEATYDNFCILGEPWEGGSTPLPAADRADQANIAKFQGYGSFNDLMRDGLIKSGMDAESTKKGWLDVEPTKKASGADTWSILHGLAGKTADSKSGIRSSDPNKAVNYVSCHDNFTVTDRIAYAYSDDKGKTTTASEKLLAEGSKVSNGLVMASQGTSFMLSGEEFGRRKIKADGTLDGNSYNASYEENAIDYSVLEDAAKQQSVEYFKKICAMKSGEAAFAMEEADIAEHVTTAMSDSHDLVSATVTKETEAGLTTYYIYAKNNTEGETEVDLGNAQVLIDSLGKLDGDATGKVTLEPMQFIVATSFTPKN